MTPAVPRPGEAHVYYLAFQGQAPITKALMEWLSNDEIERADGMCFELLRHRFLISHLFLRRILADYLTIHPSQILIERSNGGKPVLPAKNLGFSLAHSDSFVAVAIGSQPEIGVDVEDRRPEIDGLGIARRYFTSTETIALAQAADIPRMFMQLWTCKEAFVKAIGKGLYHPLDSFSVNGLNSGTPEYSWIGSEHGSPSEWTLKTWTPSPESTIAIAVKSPEMSISFTSCQALEDCRREAGSA